MGALVSDHHKPSLTVLAAMTNGCEAGSSEFMRLDRRQNS